MAWSARVKSSEYSGSLGYGRLVPSSGILPKRGVFSLVFEQIGEKGLFKGTHSMSRGASAEEKEALRPEQKTPGMLESIVSVDETETRQQRASTLVSPSPATSASPQSISTRGSSSVFIKWKVMMWPKKK